MSLSSEHASSFNDTDAQPNQGSFQVRRNARPIVRDLSLDSDTEIGQMCRIAHFPNASGRRQEGLGRDAAAVHAGPTDIASGKDGRFQFLRAAVQSSTVSTHTASHNRHIKIVLSTLARFQIARASV
jgi:hypothetical protein